MLEINYSQCQLLGSANGSSSYWLSRFNCSCNTQVGQDLATWSLHIRVAENTLLHLLVLGNSSLDIADDALKLLLFIGVTGHSSHQDSSCISETFLSQRPVTCMQIEILQAIEQRKIL